MSSIEIIQSILHSKYRFSNQNCLIEEDLDDKGKPFKVEYPIVKKRGVEVELFRFDKNAFPFFNDVSDIKKMCDYILFAEEGKWLHIFVIELKLSNIPAQKQLKAGMEFAQFIINSAERVGKKIENYKIRKIRICDKKIKKRGKDSALDGEFEFDKNDYCEYQINNFYLAPLMKY